MRILRLSSAILLLSLACDGRQLAGPNAPKASARSTMSPLGDRFSGPPSSLVFYSRRGGSLAKIYTMDPDGADATPITSGPGNDTWPDLSPDGKHVAFVSGRTGNNEIFVLDLATGSLADVSNNPADDNWPRWSPNGRQIAFHTNRDGNYNIYVVNADGTGLRGVTSDAALDQWPDWSPNGQQLAFRRGNDVYVADADAEEQNVRRLTYLPATIDQMPAWSPDGQQIAFMSLREGYCAVFVMNADGTNQVNLTPKNPADAANAWCSRAPSWSRNGQWIYFMSFRPATNGDVELFAMHPDGSGVTRLTNSSGEDGGPRSR